MKASAPVADQLSSDLVPYVSAPDVNIFVVSILKMDTASRDEEDGVNVEHGHLTGKVEESLSGPPLPAGAPIQVPFRRIADPPVRVRNRFDAWNALKLIPGSFLVMACRPSVPPGNWTALAAQNIDSLQSPLVSDIRRAVEIEKTAQSAEQKAAAYSSALRTGGNFLVSYSLDALGRRALLGKQRGAEVVAQVLPAAPNAENRLHMASTLTDPEFFDPEHGADHTNEAILGAIAQAFVQEHDAAARSELLDDLARLLLSEFSGNEHKDKQIRTQLVKGLPSAVNQRVLSALSEYKKTAGTDEQERIADLLHTWQSALRSE